MTRDLGRFVAVAGLIAATAFGAGQIVEGAGVIVALLGSTAWVAYNVQQERARG